MNTDKNIASVNAIYAAFGRQDVPAILELLSDDVEWEFGATEHGIPWLRPGRGKAAVAAFFQALGALEVHDFRVLATMGSGPWVVALAALECTVKASGRRLREVCEPHVWRFDDAGRIVAMRHAADTWHHARALGLI